MSLVVSAGQMRFRNYLFFFLEGASGYHRGHFFMPLILEDRFVASLLAMTVRRTATTVGKTFLAMTVRRTLLMDDSKGAPRNPPPSPRGSFTRFPKRSASSVTFCVPYTGAKNTVSFIPCSFAGVFLVTSGKSPFGRVSLKRRSLSLRQVLLHGVLLEEAEKGLHWGNAWLQHTT